MRNVARDNAVVVDGVVLHQFIKGFVPLVSMRIFPRELDKIQNFDSLFLRIRRRLAQFLLFRNPCLQVFVGFRPDVFSATVCGNEKMKLEEAGIELVVGLPDCCRGSTLPGLRNRGQWSTWLTPVNLKWLHTG